MTSYRMARATGARIRRWAGVASLATAALATLPMGGCSPDEVLSVTDPDLINPSDVQSAAGANAVRLGALNRLNIATSGSESLLLLGGLFADEWINGDSFIARQQVDRRAIPPENDFLTTANRTLHRARLSARQAVELLEEFSPDAPAWHVAEMHFIQAYVVNILAEHYCDGLILSDVVDGREVYGSPITTAEAYEQALESANTGIAMLSPTSTDTVEIRVLNELRLIKGKILLNQRTAGDASKATEAAAAVAAIPTAFVVPMRHSITTNSNAFWSFNVNSFRYSVGNSEGGNGLNFATANDPRLPVCVGGTSGCITRTTRDDGTTPLHVQRLWFVREASVNLLTGIEARLIEAEALLPTNPQGALDILNALRTRVTGLAPLTLATTPAAQLDQLFRERAFWLFGRGTRTGDLRRLIRQYGRTEDAVFPTGEWHKGGPYGDDVNFPVPQAEQNNPNVPAGQVCINRSA